MSNEIIKRLMENRINSGVRAISLDPEKVKKAMDQKDYPEDQVLEFLYDEYGLEDGEDYQIGNGELEFMFYLDSDLADRCIRDLGFEDKVKEAVEVDPIDQEEVKMFVGKPLKDLLYELDGRLRISIESSKPTPRYGVSGFSGTVNGVTWEWADMIIVDANLADGKFTDVYIDL